MKSKTKTKGKTKRRRPQNRQLSQVINLKLEIPDQYRSSNPNQNQNQQPEQDTDQIPIPTPIQTQPQDAPTTDQSPNQTTNAPTPEAKDGDKKGNENEADKNKKRDPYKWTRRFLAAAVLVMGGFLLSIYLNQDDKDDKEKEKEKEKDASGNGGGISLSPIDKPPTGGGQAGGTGNTETLKKSPEGEPSTAVTVLFWLVFAINIFILLFGLARGGNKLRKFLQEAWNEGFFRRFLREIWGEERPIQRNGRLFNSRRSPVSPRTPPLQQGDDEVVDMDMV